MQNNQEKSIIIYMATFPPRECGIATFTRDLTTAIDRKFSSTVKSKILAMNRNGINIYNYPKNVAYQLDDNDMHEYIELAKRINKNNQIKLVCIQHEFGIFGGKYGDHLIPFLEILEKPVIITLHSILPKPDDRLKKVVQSIAEKVKCFVVMTRKGKDILEKDYGVKTDISIVPHGIPSVTFSKAEKEKAKMGFKDKIILSSFGLVNPDKGYEYVIDALPDVVKKFPNLLYLIVGETHPLVRKKEGEKYRTFLEKKIKKLGLQKNIKFYNKYLTLKEIIKYLKISDVYISSSVNPDQITSGTLVYAMGCGKAVVSTPFLHAKDIVNHKRGVLAKFNDPKSFTKGILKILSNPKLKDSMEKEAYCYTRHMTWPNVAIAYMDLFNKYVGIPKTYGKKLPSIKLNHMIRLTDEFGIMQFAKYIKPDQAFGYTLDDNARAMIVACMCYTKFKDDSKLKLIKRYLDFIKYVQQPDGNLYNYVDYDKKINFKRWTYDAHTRALWALGYLISIKSLPRGLKAKAEKIFVKALKLTRDLKFPRSIAFTIIGLYFYNKANPSARNINKIKKLADHLVSSYKTNSSDKWKWFEEKLTYSNSKLPESLFYAYLATKNKKYFKIAESSLDFLSSATIENNMFIPIGNKGWYSKNGQKAYFDQQPVDAASMVQTLVLANKITKKEQYIKDAHKVFQWFLGNNSLNQMVYDESTGGCRDGVNESSINFNQGAESTVSYLMARLNLLK